MEEELKKAIRCAVRDGIEDALTKYGVDTTDPTAMQADMVYLRKSRTGSDEILKWGKRSAITAAATGVLVALWQGIKSIINGG
ncbi:MAG: hypothetical protein O2832_02160 [Proteobacteria bacterium]|nr:hypothetical protein [Pseudomonadota bacterium]